MSTRPALQRHAFPSTRWSRILADGGARDLEALARTYWRPIHDYLAARLRLGPDAAADLTQEAFAWMLATRLLDRADPARGRFRGLLKKALANFAIEHLRKHAAAKRGGAAVHESIEAGAEPADPASRTPDRVLDDAWRRELLEVARQRLESELTAGGRVQHWLVFRDYFLADGDGSVAGEELDQTTLAARHCITRTDVANWLAHAKRRYREILRGVVLETVSDAEELEEELRWLFGTSGAARA